MTPRQRADVLLVARGFFDSRAKAQAAIAAGRVTADGALVRRASEPIVADAQIAAEPAYPWVSRGGIKLAFALDRLAIDVTGHTGLDIGASTGGFTEVLLARGARRIFAVDVGRDQLHASLRGRPEIVCMEAIDIRTLDPAVLDEPPSIVTVDVSFISLKQVLPCALALAGSRASLVGLIKPQFEVGAPRRLKKGIVRDPAIHTAVCADIAACVAALGWQVDAIFPSPIAGGDGNREFFIGAHRG